MNAEVENNHSRFEERWVAEMNASLDGLRGNEAYIRSYARLVSFQAWRSEILQEHISVSALQFAMEGQNDLLASYLLARVGQWRSSLQSLRAALENYANCLYFMDHPVEVKLWERGKFRNQFSDLMDYFSKHPRNLGLSQEKYGLDIIRSEYATLSKAVHASAVHFRMSSNDGPRLFKNDIVELNKWETRNVKVCRGLNLLLLSLFREHLVAARKRNLRTAIGHSFGEADVQWIKETYSVTIKV